jgi:hypothetical protein
MRAYDLVIRSELPVPGAVAIARQETCDIEIVRGRIDVVGCGQQYRRVGDALLIDFPSRARFLCRHDHIEVDEAPGADMDRVTALLIANALPACLWMRHDLVLHASAFAPRGAGAVVAVCGPSGTGKSTALATFVARGAQVVADDTIRVVGGPDGPVASGLPGLYWLKAEADGETRTAVTVAPDRSLSRAPLAALFITMALEGGGRPYFDQVAGSAKLAALIQQLHRPAIGKLLELQTFVLPMLAQAANLPVYRWYRPIGPPVLEEAELDFLTQTIRNMPDDHAVATDQRICADRH